MISTDFPENSGNEKVGADIMCSGLCCWLFADAPPRGISSVLFMIVDIWPAELQHAEIVDVPKT